MPFAVAEIVFASATVELSVPVVTPLALVLAAGCVSVLPLPVAASTTVALLRGDPLVCFTVTVIVDVPLPAAMVAGAAATVDSDCDTLLGVTVTVTVLVIATPLTVAETTFASATIELSVP